MHYTTAEELLCKFKNNSYLCTDSRKVMPGSIFFALKGDKFNANAFASKAIENGAAFAVIDDPDMFTGSRTLLVENVLDSLQALASLYRSQLIIPIIGITGTNGKTTTKELVSVVLSTRFNTIATPGNFNNHIGVPLTLLSIKPDTEIAVVEMGANHRGEIADLCKIARPTHGLITNIGKAHLEGFGGFEGVKIAKRELYEYLTEQGGTVFVNSGDDLLMQMSHLAHRIAYGSNVDDEIIGIPHTDADGYLTIDLMKPVTRKFSTKLAGDYNFSNVMAALCIAVQFRVDINQAIDALESYVPGMNRSQIKHTQLNTLILDAYNANPSSMRLAIENFNRISAGTKVMILGDMFELGDESEAEHAEIVRLIKEMTQVKVYTAGPYFLNAARGIDNIKSFTTTEDMREALKENPPEKATILIKGSRGMKLEVIIDYL